MWLDSSKMGFKDPDKVKYFILVKNLEASLELKWILLFKMAETFV